MVNKPGLDKSQISVHNVAHPYRFTKEMLTSMRVLRQLDEKFIVGVVSHEGERSLAYQKQSLIWQSS